MMKIEAFDLADKGDSTTYFRREMSILNKVLAKPEIELSKILNEFTKYQIEDIYPALSPILVQILTEELELMDYVSIEKGKVTVTKKGEAKLKEFIESLTPEEREALKI
jgi:predicted methyltransferase